ncbi:WXG100 family type VII secretion target [Streptomyces sp. NPDC059740]|uniref:WXG100 family type VII secretion target n=1 Tax=Streptomyces sp. NPDC059740 TaxID=3346926 RepID=UPI0036632975
MAGQGLQVDVASLHTGGTRFSSIGDRYQSAVDKLQSGLTSLEGQDTPPWGDDEVGEKFGIAYEGLRDGMYESMGHLAQQLQKIGAGLSTMANNHEQNESDNDTLMQTTYHNNDSNSQQIAQFRAPHVSST